MLLRKDEEMKKQMLEEVLKIQEEHRKEKESLEKKIKDLASSRMSNLENHDLLLLTSNGPAADHQGKYL